MEKRKKKKKTERNQPEKASIWVPFPKNQNILFKENKELQYNIDVMIVTLSLLHIYEQISIYGSSSKFTYYDSTNTAYIFLI